MITEQELREGIKKFASEISSEPLGEVYHQPENDASPLSCFQNVLIKVKKDGGGILFGWTFSYRFNAEYGDYLMATHHAIWCSPDQILLDVTPFTDNQKHHPLGRKNYIIFLADQLAEPVQAGDLLAPLPLKFFALNDNQKLRAYVKEMEQEEYKACQELYEGKFSPHQITGRLYKGKFYIEE